MLKVLHRICKETQWKTHPHQFLQMKMMLTVHHGSLPVYFRKMKKTLVLTSVAFRSFFPMRLIFSSESEILEQKKKKVASIFPFLFYYFNLEFFQYFMQCWKMFLFKLFPTLRCKSSNIIRNLFAIEIILESNIISIRDAKIRPLIFYNFVNLRR